MSDIETQAPSSPPAVETVPDDKEFYEHYRAELLNSREQFKSKCDIVKQQVNRTIDSLLDDELDFYFLDKHHTQKHHPDRRNYGAKTISWIWGIYYLTLARFTNPIAYKMAWRIIQKLRDHEEMQHD